MILFFHFLCLLAQYIASNISKSISKKRIQSDDGERNSSITNCSCIPLQNKKKITKQPIYEDGTLKFFPPVYVQRYETVALIIEEFVSKEQAQKVADFGCSELGFFMYLKHMSGVTEILEIDIDEQKLERYSFKAAPLTSDYLMNKFRKPLDVYILAGSVADYDDHLAGTDIVIAIELIEHLTETTLDKMTYNIFQKIKPKLSIFTTPNAEFNSLFPNFTDLRHNDHKFEWTRKEFYTWTQEIVNQYPQYWVRFYGIGPGPEGTENLGCCTQMAVFQKSEDSEMFESAREKLDGFQNYKLIYHYTYPLYKDLRTTEEKVIQEIQYVLPYFCANSDYYNYDTNETEIPLSLLEESVMGLCSSEEQFRNILKSNGMEIRQKDGCSYLVHNESQYSSDECIEEDEEGWINENVDVESHNEIILEDSWDFNEDLHYNDESNIFQTARSEGHLKSAERERNEFSLLNNFKLEQMTLEEPKIVSSLHNKTMPKQLACSINSSRYFENNLEENNRQDPLKSRIPKKINNSFEVYSHADLLQKKFISHKIKASTTGFST